MPSYTNIKVYRTANICSQNLCISQDSIVIEKAQITASAQMHTHTHIGGSTCWWWTSLDKSSYHTLYVIFKKIRNRPRSLANCWIVDIGLIVIKWGQQSATFTRCTKNKWNNCQLHRRIENMSLIGVYIPLGQERKKFLISSQHEPVI